MAAQAPVSATAQVSDGYITAWAAVTRLLARGGSLSGHEPNTCFLNLGRGSQATPAFADISGAAHFDFLDDARAMALTDWDFDGDLDVWVLNRTAPALRFLDNSKPDQGHFIALLLDSPNTNRDAIGARVTVELTGDANQHIVRSRTVTAGSGFLSQPTRWLHFGLGHEMPSIARVHVRWPDGSEQTTGPLTPDRFYDWTQGSAPRERTTKGVVPSWAQGPPHELPRVKDTAAARIVLAGRPALPRVDKRIQEIHEPTLVTCWASWCNPCLAELSEWWKQRDEFEAHGLKVLALNVDDPADHSADPQERLARETLEKLGVDFPSVVLPAESAAIIDFFQQSLMALQAPLALPTSFLVDSHGRVAVIYKGGVTSEQIIHDLELLNLPDQELVLRAAGLSGQWLRAPRGEDANLVAARLQDEGLTAAAMQYLETTIGLVEAGHGSRRGRPVAELWFTLARLRLQASDYEGALAAYRKTIELASDHLGAHQECGKLLFDRGQPEEARSLLQRAIELNPRASGSMNLLALCELQVGTIEAAVRYAEQSVAVAPSDPRAHFTLGLCWQQSGRWQQALEAYEQTLKLNSAWLVARNNRAWILATAPDEAVRDGAQAIQLMTPLVKLASPDHLLFQRTLAAAYAESGDFTRAADLVREALNEPGANTHPLKQPLHDDLHMYSTKQPIRLRESIR